MNGEPLEVVAKTKNIQDLPKTEGMKWGRGYIVTHQGISGPWSTYKKEVNLYAAFDKEFNLLKMWQLK